MGLSQTFSKSAVIFTLIGMVFGWPFAMHHSTSLGMQWSSQWVKTSIWKRIIRMILGVGVAFGIDYFFRWTVHTRNDLPT